MKIAHNVKISVFAYDGEDADSIRRAMISLLPFNLEDEKLSISECAAKGFGEKRISIGVILLEKQRHISKFLDSLRNSLTQDQIKLLAQQAESRLDRDINFFIRLDKPSLIDGDYHITDSGNCFHIRINIAAYPVNRENGLKLVNRWIQGV
ncbi:hypothetical protein HQ545_05080 [Candidatus Woesearchaeota archaeon]|nr:hypothetical protein [Candidatus Woesearchaeota archaeon]